MERPSTPPVTDRAPPLIHGLAPEKTQGYSDMVGGARWLSHPMDLRLACAADGAGMTMLLQPWMPLSF